MSQQQQSKPPLDLVALQRALVFTKLDYRGRSSPNLTLYTQPSSAPLTPVEIPAAAPVAAVPVAIGVGYADHSAQSTNVGSEEPPHAFDGLGLYGEATWVEHATAEAIARHAVPAGRVSRTDPFEPDDVIDDLADAPDGLIPWTCD